MYTIERKTALFTSHGSLLSAWVVRDEFTQEETGLKILEKYLAEGSAVLSKEVMLIADTSKPLTKADIDRLQAMFVLLIDARKAWQEDSASLHLRQKMV